MCMKRLLLALAAAQAAGTPGYTAPLERNDVAANPALVFHVDLDALRNCSVGRAILSQPDVETKLSAIQALFNFDFRTQLHGLTVYSADAQPKACVVIFYADFEPDRLVTLARTFQDFQSVTNGSRVIYSWQNNGGPRVYAAIQGHRVLFEKNSADAITGALDVIAGNSPHADEKVARASGSGQSVLVQAQARKFDFDNDVNANAAILQKAKEVRLQVGEAQDQMTATLALQARDAETATQINSIAQALPAILRLQQGNPDALKLANAINFRQDGDTVTATLSIPSAQMVDIIKDDMAKKTGHEASAGNGAPTNTTATNQ